MKCLAVCVLFSALLSAQTAAQTAETQIFRLKEREGIPTEEALRRIRSQADPAERRKIAHLIIDTSGSVEETRAKAKQAFGRLRSDWEALQASEEKSE